MYFKDIVGQEEAKSWLIKEAKEGKIAHAKLFCGNEGAGKLPLAIAYARYLSCQNPMEDDACGTCPNCVKYNKLAHPDLHFVFPIIKKKNKSKEPVCDEYIAEWREIISSTPYFNLNMWLKEMGAENQQALIYAKESDEILKKLSLKSSQGGYKVMIMWLPEKMNVECSNKLLKLLEEPPTQTIFILISEEPDMLLPTIQSRVQRFNIHAIDKEKIAETSSKGNQEKWYDKETDRALADVITLHDEAIPAGDGYEIFDPSAVWKRKKVNNFYAKNLRVQIFDKGECVYESPSVDEIRQYCQEQMETLWSETLRFENPQTYYVDLSQKLWDIKYNLLKRGGGNAKE